MESVDWTAKVHGGRRRKGKDKLDGMMDDYDEVMTEMASRKGELSHDGHKSPMFWPEDKLMFMKELTRYRNLYLEMAKLLKAAKKTFHKRAKEFAKKEKSFQKQAKDFMQKENQFIEKDNMIVQKEKLFRSEIEDRDLSCKNEVEAVRRHMEEMMESKANNYAKALEVRAKEFQHREKTARAKLDSKLESKELHFTKVCIQCIKCMIKGHQSAWFASHTQLSETRPSTKYSEANLSPMLSSFSPRDTEH